MSGAIRTSNMHLFQRLHPSLLLLHIVSGALAAFPYEPSDAHLAETSGEKPVKDIPQLTIDQKFRAAYQSAPKRVFFFDSNGVLRHGDSDLERARRLVIQLAADAKNKVYILSARTMDNLRSKYDPLPRVIFASEHGLEKFDPSAPPGFQTTSVIPKEEVNINKVANICQNVVEASRKEGEIWGEWAHEYTHRVTYKENFVEKESVKEMVTKLQAAVKAKQTKLPRDYEVKDTTGHGYIIVKPPEANKGLFVQREFPQVGAEDFFMCMGDSVSEEPMHKHVNNLKTKHKYSVIVSTDEEQKSSALYKLSNVPGVHDFLDDMLQIK